MAKDSRIYGIHLNDQVAAFAKIDGARGADPPPNSEPLKRSIWQLIDSGFVSENAPLNETVKQLKSAANSLDAFRGPLDETLNSSKKPTRAFGLTVPYFSTPITRQIATEALRSSVDRIINDSKLQKFSNYRIYLVEIPIAVAFACRAEFERECMGIFLPGRGGNWEATIVDISPTKISVVSCLEDVRPNPDRASGGAPPWIHHPSSHAAPESWVVPDEKAKSRLQTILSVTPLAKAPIEVRGDLEKTAALGAAQFAVAMEETPPDAATEFQRILPRSLGLFGWVKEELVWKCLLRAGTVASNFEFQLLAKLRSMDSPPNVVLAALADETIASRWLSALPQRTPGDLPKLLWWADPCPLSPAPEVGDPGLSLTIACDSMPQRVRAVLR